MCKNDYNGKKCIGFPHNRYFFLDVDKFTMDDFAPDDQYIFQNIECDLYEIAISRNPNETQHSTSAIENAGTENIERTPHNY